ncbi:phosphopantetheine-binding protein [Streptomyces sp. DSM 44915]|uniref:Phosphopantetheine-binding protein n=1 Tax=Streptomyces chisholmiae TaxID=3075540 RepID=A0ABU2JRU5_9ACTN|nr:phosphopantetheine-binding protein [Streptomyces sp. DSM 44915]MDT0267444.1 phosphopantetheine-binding protein [Streptomyces sp. DSM 44915]
MGTERGGGAESDRELGALVAAQLARMLADLGGTSFSRDAIMTDESLRNRDLVQFGLGSLDWIRLAVRVGEETGLELPEKAFVDAEFRTVAGWTTALAELKGEENHA